MNNDNYEKDVENFRKKIIDIRKAYFQKKGVPYPQNESIKFYAYNEVLPKLKACSECGSSNIDSNSITEGCNMSGDGNGYGFHYCKECGYRFEYRWRD